jgi:hypothetical protein
MGAGVRTAIVTASTHSLQTLSLREFGFWVNEYCVQVA